MAIQDKLALFSDDVALTSTGTTYSDVINTKDSSLRTSGDAPIGVGADIGKGNYIPLNVQVTETFTTSASGTLTVTLQTATDEAFTSPVDLMVSPTNGVSALPAGKKILPQVVPYGSLGFLRLKYVVATGAMTAGKITASLGDATQTNQV